MSRSLYDTDFIRWSAEQAAALRGRTGEEIDWEHVAEEIEDLGRALRRELGSRTSTIIEHLIKLERSSAQPPRPGWIETVTRTRGDVQRLLDDDPSLRRELPEAVAREELRAARNAAVALKAAGEPHEALLAQPQGNHWTLDHVYGDWLPDEG